MNILILEDNQERLEFFRRVYKNHNLYITKDIDDAYDIVKTIELDILFLDHDLEPETFHTSRKEGRTGYDFVKMLALTKLQIHSLIYVHSCNPVGGQTMVNWLQDNGYRAFWIPYYLLIQEDR